MSAENGYYADSNGVAIGHYYQPSALTPTEQRNGGTPNLAQEHSHPYGSPVSSHGGSTGNISHSSNSSNCWAVNSRLAPNTDNQQNLITSSSGTPRHDRTAPPWPYPQMQQYQRMYNENNYGLAIAASLGNGGHHQHQHHQSHGHHNAHQQTQAHNLQVNHQNSVAQQQQQNAGSHQTKRFYQQGKTSNNKDICGDDKHNKEDGDPWNVEAQAAFLGPNLWDKTLPYDSDLKVHQYADLDEFLSENGIPVDGLPSSHLGSHSTSLGHRSDSLGHCTNLSLGLSQVTKRERSPSPSDCMSPDTINPPSPADSNDLKDDKYWARRRKNNMAAKRSRDARRMKENQIALRAGFLEKENMNLHREVEQLKQENMELRARLSKYQDV